MLPREVTPGAFVLLSSSALCLTAPSRRKEPIHQGESDARHLLHLALHLDRTLVADIMVLVERVPSQNLCKGGGGNIQLRRGISTC